MTGVTKYDGVGERTKIREAADQAAQAKGDLMSDPATIQTAHDVLDDIREELSAEELDLSDTRQEELQEKRATIESYLSRAVGKDGQIRTIGGRADGQAVGKAIERAMKQIKKVHEPLWIHLDTSVHHKHGDSINYTSDRKTRWTVTM